MEVPATKINFIVSTYFQSTPLGFALHVHPNVVQASVESFDHMRFLGTEAPLAIAQAVRNIGSEGFEEVGFVTVKHADVVAVFKSKKRRRLQHRLCTRKGTANPNLDAQTGPEKLKKLEAGFGGVRAASRNPERKRRT